MTIFSRPIARLFFAASIAFAASCGGGNDSRTPDVGTTAQALVVNVSCEPDGFDPGLGLIQAINDANADGPGPHTINLASNCHYQLENANNNWFGPTALPPITSDITIVGNGAQIERNSGAASNFRLFYVAGALSPGLTPGKLTLRNVTVRRGRANGGAGGSAGGGGGGGMGAGGCIFVHGELVLDRALMRECFATGGAGGAGGFGGGGGGGGMGGSGAATGGGGGFQSATTADGGDGLGVSEGGLANGTGGTFASGSEDGTNAASGVGGSGGGARGLGNTGGETAGGTLGAAGDGGGGGVRGGGDGGGGGAGFGGNGGAGFANGGGGGAFGGGGGAGAGTGLAAGGGGVGGGGGGSPHPSTGGGGGGGGFGGGGGGGGEGGDGGFGGGGGGGANGGDPAGVGGFGGGAGNTGFPAAGGGGLGAGGAIFVHQGAVTISNSTLTENRAIGGASGGASAGVGAGLGGGIFNLNGTVTILSATLDANIVSSTGTGGGGATYVTSFGAGTPTASATFTNSIFADSVDTQTPTPAQAGDVALNEVSGTASLTAAADNIFEMSVDNIGGAGTVTGTASIGDPGLGTLQGNGGPTFTMMPAAASLPVDNANVNEAACTASPVGDVDQRNYPRNVGACDIGAVERGSIGAPAQLTVSIPPTNEAAGATITPAIVIQARDDGGQFTSGFTGPVTLAIANNPSGGTLTGTTTVNAISGEATFSDLSINNPGTGYTLIATSPGLTSATSPAFNITGPATHLVFNVGPSSATAGVAINPAIVVHALDANNNLDTTFTGNIGLAIGTNPGSGTLTGGGAVAASGGIATFSGASINKSGTGYTLVTTSSLTNATSGAINISPAAANHLAFGVQPSNVNTGATISPSVTVRALDAFDNLDTSYAANVSLAIGNNPGSGTLTGGGATAASGGIATFAGLSINSPGVGYTLTASSGSLAGDTSLAFNVTNAAADHLVITVQPSNTTAGATMSPAVVVEARNASNAVDTAFSGPITLAIGTNPGGGTLTGGTSGVLVNGVATFSGLSINKSGTGYTLVASATGVTDDTSSTFNIVAAAANHVVFGVQPSNTTAGATMSPSVTVRALDANDNLDLTFNGNVSLAIGNNPGSGTLTGGGAVAASGGVATFNGLSINKSGIGYTLVASSSLPDATSTSFNIVAAAANHLVFGVQPSNASAGATITPAVTVRALDANNNLDTTFTANVSLSIGNNPGGGTLTGGGAVAASGGVATFAGLSINAAGSGYTLNASSTVTGATSSSFNITAGAATHLVFDVQPSTTVAGATITPAVTVRALDNNDNLDTTFNANVSLAIGNNPGSGTLTGGGAVAASGGVATFAGLSINKSGNGYTLVASSSITGVTSSSFNITPGAATHLGFGVQPSTTAAGASITPAVTVRALDANDNVDPTFVGMITVARASGPVATLNGTLTRTASSGVATFNNLSLNVSGSYTLSASSTVTGATSNSFTITSAGPDHLAFVTQPSNANAGVAITPAVTVEMLDQFGNRVTSFTSGITVAKASGPSAGVLSGTLTQNAVAGLSTFANLSIDKNGGYTLGAAASGVPSITSNAFNINPAAAQNLFIAQQPTNTTAGQAISTILVEAHDQFGNLNTAHSGMVMVAINANPGGGTLSGTTTVSFVNGVASFSDLSINKAGNGYTLTFTSSGLNPATTSTFNITSAAANHVAFVVQPSNTVAGVAIAPAVIVHVRDQFDNIATTFNGDVSMAIANNPGSSTLTGTTTVTAIAGIATFSNLRLNKVGTGYTLTASVSGLTSGTSSGFNITPATANHLVFNVQPSTTVAGVAITPAVVVHALDQFDNLDTNFALGVTIAIGNNPGTSTLGGTLTRTASGGVAMFNNLTLNKVGTGYTLVASRTGMTSGTSAAFNITPAAANHLVYQVQPTQVVAGVSIAPAVMVAALDQFDNVDTNFTNNVTVVLQANPGSSTLSGTTTQTPVQGVATFGNLSLNKAASGYRLRASATGVGNVDSNLFTVIPAAASVLVYTQNPTNVVAGFAISPSIVVQARDPFDNLATSYTSAVTLSIQNNPGSSTLGGLTSVNAVGGVATFATISLNKVGTGYTLLASGPTVTSVVSLGFNVTPAVATKLVFTVQPTDQLAGSVITPAIEVRARDQFDNLATGFNGQVTISINNNPGGSNLLGTTMRTASAGVVTFNDLSLNRVGDGYTLSVTAANLTPAISAPFNIVSGMANRLFFTVQPTTTTSGAAISPAVQITVRDNLGNVATTFTGNISIAIFANPGGSTLSGTTTVAAVAGVATFNSLSLDRVGSGYTLIATGSGLSSAISTTFNITPATAATLHFTVQPGDVVAGVAHSPSIQVTARDAAGNLAANFAGMVTLAIANNPGGATLGGTLTRTAASGIATFPGITLDKVGLDYTLSASSTGLPAATSAAFDVTPAPANHLGFTVEPTSTAAGDPIAPPVRVTAFDPFDNVATAFTGAVTVAIGLNPGGSVLSGTTTVSAVAGVATFSTLSLDRAAPGYTLTAAAAGLTGTTSAMFEITNSNASRLVFTVQPTNTVAGVAITPSVRVEARDTSGNLDISFNGMVSLSIGNNPGNATLMGTPMVMASGGVATFNGISLDKVGTGYTLVGGATGLVSATSSAFNITPAAASQLVFATQPLDAVAGTFLAPPVRVEARDAFDNVDTSFTGAITVALGANPGLSTLSGTLVVNSVAGVASFADLSLDHVGTGYTLMASATGMTAVTSATFNITPAAATRLGFNVQPVNTPAGQFIAPAVVVEALDPFGNRATSFAGAITLALGNNPGGSTLSGTLSGPAVLGARTYNDLLLDRVGMGYTLTASATGLAGATSSSFDVTPGAATSLVFAVQPSDAVAGAAIAPAIRVEVQDDQGNVVPSFTGNITITIGTNPGGATLSGTATLAAVAGVALYNDLSLDRQGSGYRLNAMAAGVSSAVSAQFNITPGAAARLAVSQQPTLTVAGQPITPAVQIAVEDNFGNRVPTFTGNISIAIQTNPGGGTLGGTTTVAASAGVASFTTLTIDRAATGYVLRATSTGLTMVDTVAFDIISGSAAALAFGVQPGDVVAGVAFSPAVTVTVRDSQGNIDPTFNGNITLAISNNPGSATLAGTISVLVTGGTATFDNVSLDKVGLDYTLAASAAGVPSATSTAFDVTAAAAATYVQTGLAANVAAATTVAVVFTAHDAFGNVATGYDGTANLTSSDTDLEAPTTVAFTDGVSASTNLEFHTPGMQTVTITDQTTSSVTATFDTNVTAVASGTIRITDPMDGEEVGGNQVPITAVATVAPEATIVMIEILVDGTVIDSGTSSPFSTTWDATGMAINSPHAITARLTDSEGNVVTSEAVTVTIMAAEDGCCSAGGDPTSPLTLAGMVLLGVLLRRRKGTRSA